MASKLFRLLTCLIFITCVYVVLLVLYTQFPVSGQSSSGRQMNSPVKTTIRSASEPRISDSTPLKIRTGKHGGTSIRFEVIPVPGAESLTLTIRPPVRGWFEVNTGRKRSNESLKNETKTPKQVLANPKGISLGEETKLPSQTTESDFQKIQSKGNIYVYSAYYNNLSSSTEVTVIGFGLLKALPRSVQCVFTRTVSSNVSHATGARAALNASAVPEVTTEGSVVALLDSHGRRYGAIFVHCALSSNMSRPDHVALITDKKRPPFSRLRVTYLDPARSSWQMALCLSPLHSNYSNWRQTVETLELVKMLGVDHVTAYVTNISADVKRVLTHYFKQGFTEVLTWRNPPQPVHNYGQMAAINDCMFRMRKVARMVVFTDLDEVIVPQRHSSYVAMLDHLRRHAKNPNGIAAFLFLNSFFYSEEQNVSPNGSLPLDRTSKLPSVTSTPLNLTAQQEKDAHSFGLQSPLSVYRTKHIFPPKDRSKLIIDPLRVTMQGIHCPQYLVRGQEVKVVDPEVALLHHYRSWRRQAKVKDTSAVRFAPRLIENVRKAWKELGVS